MRVVKHTAIQMLALMGIAMVTGLGVNAVRDEDHIKIGYPYERAGARPGNPTPTTQAAPPTDSNTPASRPDPHGGAPASDPHTVGNGNATPSTASGAPEFLSGYRVVHVPEVQALVADPRFATRQILLIDARDDHAYRAGHLPGAVQFDRYRPDQYRPRLEEALSYAPQQIIVYCNGGDCEDSLEVCVLLETDFYQPRGAILLFKGGWEAWAAAKLPVKTGAEE